MKKFSFALLLMASACASPGKDPLFLKREVEESMNKVTKTYQNYAELIEGEKENCITVREKWRFERVHLDEKSVVIEHRDPKKHTLTRAFANLLCITELRTEEKILRFSQPQNLLSSTSEQENHQNKFGVIPLKFTAFDEEGKPVKLRPTRELTNHRSGYFFLRYDGEPKLPHFVVVEVNASFDPGKVMKHGEADVESSVPLYGVGTTMLIQNHITYNLYPLFSGIVEGEWVGESSQSYKASK